MTSRRLNRSELEAIVGRDPRALRAFERLLADVQADIAGPSTITLNYAADGTLSSPLPVTASFTLTPENGSAFTSGVSWGVTVLSGSFDGAAPNIAGTGTGVLRINSGLESPTAILAVTARVSGRGYPPFSVTVTRTTSLPDQPSGGGTANDTTFFLTLFNSSSFTAITRNLVVTLPLAATDVTLTAANITLSLDGSSPVGSTQVEFKWQREASPGVWADVGSAATSNPSPFVFDEGFGAGFFTANDGSITCNRTATGLTGGDTETFRLVARISSGNIRPVFPNGSASASA
jgi:hypothetical protein